MDTSASGHPSSASFSSASQDRPDARFDVPRNGSKLIPPKLYRIGEVVDYSGLSRQTIHNYTTMGLLHESRWTRGGHRLYDESVFYRLDQIAQLRSASRSLDDIREQLARQDAAAAERA